MPVFVYTGRSTDGGTVESRMDAGSAEIVAARLIDAGITPIKIGSADDNLDPLEKLRREWFGQKVPLEELIVFSRQMYTLARAGLPIIRAVSLLGESSKSEGLKSALSSVADALRSGRELSAALRMHSKIFPTLMVSVVEVGENTGRLDLAFQQIAHYLDQERETRKRIQAATRYPIMVIGAIVGAIFLINIFVVPAFSKVFDALGADLPWATRVLIGTSDFTVRFWPAMVFLAVVTVASLRFWVGTDPGRLTWDQWRLKIPLVGDILLRATISRYARTFAMTASSGLPVLQTLAVVARTVGNAWVAERVLAMRTGIERGETLTRAAATCGLFTPLVLEMMLVGEETGTIAEMHQEVAEAYEREVDYDLRKLSDMIEPMLIVFVGAIVFVLALGVYLPMWDLTNAAKPS